MAASPIGRRARPWAARDERPGGDSQHNHPDSFDGALLRYNDPVSARASAVSRGPPASAHGVGRTSSAGDYAWFDDNLFQLRPEDDTSTFRLHSSGGRRRHGRDGGGGGQDSSADASLRADFSSPDAHAASVAARTTYTASYHHATTAKGHTKGSYVRPGRTLRLGAAVAAGGANAQVGPIDVASLRTTYQGPDRVREKNRQRHLLQQ